MNGQELCVVEQYLGDPLSTYEEKGKLRAAQAGIVKIDPKIRKITIKTDKEPLEVKKGDKVIAEVVFIRKFSVGASIYKVGDEEMLERMFGNIHISKIADAYISDIEEAYQKTDIIRAEVIGERNGEPELSTKYGPDLGVIYAQCNICGNVFTRQTRNLLKCNFCGNRAKKKLANDYFEK